MGYDECGSISESPPPPPVEGKLRSAAFFSVVAPEAVAPQQHFVVEVFVHDKKGRETLLRWSHNKDSVPFTVGPTSVARGTTLDVELTIDGAHVEQNVGCIFWDDELGVLLFPCTVAEDAFGTSCRGLATFSVNQVTLARVPFVMSITPRGSSKPAVLTELAAMRSAFASYATEDRRAVLARIQGMQKAAPFIDIFLDAVSLRSGENWKEAIQREIKARDVLLLFWSLAASHSSFVETEWRMALKEKGLSCISPVPLESPAVAPPPPALSALHFGDWTLAVQ
jgi:hypothetical protein